MLASIRPSPLRDTSEINSCSSPDECPTWPGWGGVHLRQVVGRQVSIKWTSPGTIAGDRRWLSWASRRFVGRVHETQRDYPLVLVAKPRHEVVGKEET